MLYEFLKNYLLTVGILCYAEIVLFITMNTSGDTASKILIKRSHFCFGLFLFFFAFAFGIFSLKPLLKTPALAATPAPQPKKEVLAAYTTCNVNPGDFTDVPVGSPNAEAVYAMAKCCVVKGKTPTQFAPNAPIVRAEVAYLIARYHRRIRQDWVDAPANVHYFSDILPTDWGVEQYNDIQTNKYNGFLLGLDAPPTSTNCQATQNPGPYSLPGNPYKGYASPSSSPCQLDAFGVWQFGFHGINRNESWRGSYNFLTPPLEYPEPAGQSRADYIRLMYEYFKEKDPNANTPLGACLRDTQATCSISATNCSTSTPGATCNSNVQWKPDGSEGSDVEIFKDGQATPIWTGATGNKLDGITVGNHTYVCKNNGVELARANATATLVQTPHSISGKVFADAGGDTLSIGDSPYSKNISITTVPSGLTVTINQATKEYSIENIPPNILSVTVTLQTTFDSGYYASVPVNSGQTPTFLVPLGSCPANLRSISGSPEVTCNGGNLANLNFGITNVFPWTQFTGFNVREDRHGIDNQTPGSIAGSCRDPKKPGKGMLLATGYTSVGSALPQTSGILYSNPVPSYNQPPFGDISQHNWNIKATGNESYKAPQLTFTYDKIPELFGKTDEKIKTFTCSANPNAICPLPTTSGVWKFDGDPTLIYNVSGGTIGANQKVFILIDGKVTFTDEIKVANDGVFVIASTGEMRVSKDIGYTSAVGYACTNAANLQGIFSTNTNFIVEGEPSVCSLGQKDRMLIVDGTVITNADLKNGSAEIGYKNERNLCDSNKQFPAVSIRQHPEFIINMPNFIKNQKVSFKEVTP